MESAGSVSFHLRYRQPEQWTGFQRSVVVAAICGYGSKILIVQIDGFQLNMTIPVIRYPNFEPLPCSEVDTFRLGNFPWPRLI